MRATHVRTVMALVVLVISAMLLTYSGRIESSDTRAMLDAISSAVHFGDRLLDESAFYTFPPPESNTGPLAPIDVEPLQLILATPLFWLAELIPGFGLAHIVWLFNLFIAAAACALLYAYTIRLGYGASVGVAAALSLGFCTILWPYSKTFFREPLALLMILLTAYALETARQCRRHRLWWLVLALTAGVCAWLTKEAIIFALPALLVIALPVPTGARLERLLVILLLLPFAALVALTLLATVTDVTALLNPLYSNLAIWMGRPVDQLVVLLPALHTYLLSIGGSVWGTSPVLLLAVPGMIGLWRRGQRRYLLAGLLMLLGFALGYALFRGTDWFGGLSWPPRFLIPVVSFLLLTTLPVWDHLLKGKNRWAWLPVGLLLGYSLWVQFTAVSLPWESYNAALPPEANGLGEWGGGLNTIQYLRWFLIPALWPSQQLDFAWIRVSAPGWALLLVMLAMVAAWQLNVSVRQKGSPAPLVRLVGLPASLIVVIGIGLRAIYYDPFYLGDRPNLHAFLPTLQAATLPGDVVMLDNERYGPFFLNYGKLAYPRIVTLADPPGESPSPEQPARIQSANPDRLIAQYTAPMIHKLADGQERLWLLADSSQWLPWRIRPVERFMTRHYYPLQELSTNPPDPEIRLIEYSTVSAPEPTAFQSAEQLTSLQFGEAVRLLGFSLPAGQVATPGTALPITLYWTALETPPRDYTVAWFLVDVAQSRVVQGADTGPAWGFATTSVWQPGVPVLDNRALRLPLDLAPGEYNIWLRLYETGAPVNLLAVSGGETVDETTALLPVVIQIEAIEQS